MKRYTRSSKGLVTSALVLMLLVMAFSPNVAGRAETSPATIYVPDDYTTIQAAVDAASAGDTIIVRDGTYTPIAVTKDDLIIKSETGAQATTIESPTGATVVSIRADNVSLSGFTVKGATDVLNSGIHLWGSSSDNVERCNISNNIISNNYAGISLCHSSNNVLKNNTVTGHKGGGIVLLDSFHNSVIGNSLQHNGYGIYLDGSNKNTLIYNIALNNKGYGIYVELSNNNTIYANNFINNQFRNVGSSSSSNIWNCPEEITYVYDGATYTNYLGNYWSDYAGSDSDGDGVGNIPYSINSDRDNYPMIQPFENYFAPPEEEGQPSKGEGEEGLPFWTWIAIGVVVVLIIGMVTVRRLAAAVRGVIKVFH